MVFNICIFLKSIAVLGLLVSHAAATRIPGRDITGRSPPDINGYGTTGGNIGSNPDKPKKITGRSPPDINGHGTSGGNIGSNPDKPNKITGRSPPDINGHGTSGGNIGSNPDKPNKITGRSPPDINGHGTSGGNLGSYPGKHSESGVEPNYPHLQPSVFHTASNHPCAQKTLLEEACSLFSVRMLSIVEHPISQYMRSFESILAASVNATDERAPSETVIGETFNQRLESYSEDQYRDPCKLHERLGRLLWPD
ncbi:hypothetical protein KEM48_010308 [Puccinia striiformis f. sp. tritici PST-130]|nr:hypothetical protein KEM48_010308 [Puccinia striiformis f. sp. tritici PST-130]